MGKVFSWIADKVSGRVLWAVIGVLLTLLGLASAQIVVGKLALADANKQIAEFRIETAKLETRVATVKAERDNLESAVTAQNEAIRQMAVARDAAESRARASAAEVWTRSVTRKRTIPENVDAALINLQVSDRLGVIGQ